jgi:tape measure domain-containing protein
MTDVVIKYSTSGLGETLKSVDQIAQAQKSLEQFLKAASKAYQAQGQDAKQASISAKEFAATNNITAASFQALIARQKEVDLSAKAIAQTLKLQAQVTKELEQANRQLANSIGDTGAKFNAVKTAFEGNAKAANEAVNAYKQLASSGTSTIQAFSELNAKFGVTSQQFKALQNNVEITKGGFQGFNSILAGVGIQLTQFATNLASKIFIDFPKTAIQTAAAFQGIKLGLDAVSGGTKEGAKNFEFVKAEAQRLGLELKQSEQNFLQLTAAAQGTALAGKPIQELFSAISGAQRVLGSSTEQQGRALLALQQVISKGTLSSEELRQQLGEALPGAFQIAARSLGLTAAELQKQLQAGAINATDFIPKFTAQLNKEFGGGIDAAAAGALANLAKVNNLTTILAENFGNELLPALNKFLELIGENSDGLEKFAAEAGKAVSGGAELLFNLFKFGVDNAELLKGALETLAIAFVAVKVATTVQAVQSFITILPVAIELVGGTSAALGILQAALIGTVLPLAALAAAVGAVTFLKLSKDIENAAIELESLRVGTDAQGGAALRLAENTKNLNEELQKKTKFTQEDIEAAKKQINGNNQILEGLKQQLKAAKDSNAVTEEQKNAKAANIAEINLEIKALEKQTETLDKTLKTERDANGVKTLSKAQIKDKTEEIKKETQALKEGAKAENDRQETAIKRAQEDAKLAAKKAEDNKEDSVKKTADKAVDEVKKQTEKEIAAIQRENEKDLQNVKLDFERNTLNPLKLENQRTVQTVEKQFTDAQNAEKLKFAQQINAENAKVSSDRAKRDSLQNDAFSTAGKLVDIQSEANAETKAALEKQLIVADSLKNIDLTKTIDTQGIINLAKQLTGITDTTVKANADVVKNAITQIESAQQKQLKDKDKVDDEARKIEQQNRERAFQEEQNKAKVDFEQSVLQPLKTQLQQREQDAQIAFEDNVLKPLKLKQQEEIDAKKLEGVEAEKAIKEKAESEIKALKDKFAADERALDRANEDAKQQRTATFNATQRALDEASAERIKELKKTPTQAPTTGNTTTTEGIRQQIQGRFIGGDVAANTPYIVGEREAELFVPGVDGTILNQKQAYDNIRLLEKVGNTKFNADAAMMNVRESSDYSNLLNEVKSLRQTVADREQTIEFPVTIQNDDQSYKQLDQMLKLQFAVLRSRI